MCYLGEELQNDVINPNFKDFKSDLYMKSVSIAFNIWGK